MATDDMSLIDLLRKPELWQDIESIIAERRRNSGFDRDSLLQNDVSTGVFDVDEIRDVFQRRVLDLLAQPAPLSAEELAENARQQLIGVPFEPESNDDALRRAIDRFVELSTGELDNNQDPRYQGRAEFDLGRWVVTDEADRDKLIRFDSIWESDDFALDAVATPSHAESFESGYDCKLIGKLVAFCSQKALVAAEQWISKYAPSIAKTVAFCTTRQERGVPLAVTVDDLFDDGDSYIGMPPDHPSPISFLADKDHVGNKVFAACLDAVGRRHLQGNDTFTQRLANCVHLLAEADRSDSVPVALTLCFAAIEAMLCVEPDKVKTITQLPGNVKTGTTVQITRYIPTILKPSYVGRSEMRREMKSLYVTRCNTIHGKKITGHSLALHDLRQIAAGIIRSAIAWRQARSQRRERSDWETLFDEMNRAAFGKTDMSDVVDLSDLVPGRLRAQQYR
jgi:hypothetical protein